MIILRIGTAQNVFDKLNQMARYQGWRTLGDMAKLREAMKK